MSKEPAAPGIPVNTTPADPAPKATTEFTPTIKKCALGGWLVTLPDGGIAARSTLGEAINFLENHAQTLFGEDLPEPAPVLFEGRRQWELEITPWYKRALQALGSFLGLRSPKPIVETP